MYTTATDIDSAPTPQVCTFQAWHYQAGNLHCELPAGHDGLHGYWITPNVLKRWQITW